MLVAVCCAAGPASYMCFGTCSVNQHQYCLPIPLLLSVQLRAAFLAADGASALRELLDNPSDRVRCGPLASHPACLPHCIARLLTSQLWPRCSRPS